MLERGRDAIETLTRLVMSTAVPTIVEFALVLGVLIVQFDWHYALVAALTIVAFLALHADRHQLAHRHSPLDERERRRRQCEGDRQPAEL